MQAVVRGMRACVYVQKRCCGVDGSWDYKASDWYNKQNPYDVSRPISHSHSQQYILKLQNDANVLFGSE